MSEYAPTSNGSFRKNEDATTSSHPGFRGKITITQEQLQYLVRQARADGEANLFISIWSKKDRKDGSTWYSIQAEPPKKWSGDGRRDDRDDRRDGRRNDDRNERQHRSDRGDDRGDYHDTDNRRDDRGDRDDPGRGGFELDDDRGGEQPQRQAHSDLDDEIPF